MVSSIKIEFFLIFIFLPIILFYISETKLIFATLYIVFFFSLWKLKKDNTFNFSRLKNKPDWKFIFLYFLIFSLLGFFYTFFVDKSLFFVFPKESPKVWLLVIILYPLFSVIPQEFVYRVFFLQRYKNILSKNLLMNYFVNSLVFSYAHIVFQNYHAVIITALVSPIFYYSYEKKSFLTCILVHSIGGLLIFTYGLGKFFI